MRDDLVGFSNLPTDQITTEVGFATAALLRRLINAKLDVSPASYRRAVQASVSAVQAADG